MKKSTKLALLAAAGVGWWLHKNPAQHSIGGYNPFRKKVADLRVDHASGVQGPQPFTPGIAGPTFRVTPNFLTLKAKG